MAEGTEENVGIVDSSGADANTGGGSIQVDTTLDENKPIEGGEETPQEEEAMVELDGQKFTASEIQEALTIQKNQSDFTAKNQEEAARLNTLARVIEEARQGITNPNVSTPGAPNQTPQQGAGSMKSAEEFRDALLGDNPDVAIAQLANYINETIGKHTTEKDAEGAFMSAHPDFTQVTNSPEFKTFMASNPLGRHLNNVNGYYEFKATSTGKALEDATAKGAKDGQLKAAAHAKAKGNLKIINSSGGVTVPSVNKITPETSHGDILNAATQFITNKRANSG